ncbi:HAMP domain-containing sensor histidine kinase [Gorillibacterium massiliense]|uniref:HAMP domain-containing sensor histidine kinase n=1 Tax=Gorillibacterium massiliense TaxID=1280390 RepID=UPI00059484AB|nr:HAMP domain-containing sensor histidine kinase [Gorillibacterium massiliense]
MKKKNKAMNKKGSLFRKLVGSYILFAGISVISIVACVILFLLTASSGNISSMLPYDVVDQNGQVKDIKPIAKFGGWVERLDGEFRVVQVFGEKETADYSYTASDLLDLTRSNKKSDNPYIGFYEKADSNTAYLVLYPRKNIEVSYTFNLAHIRMTGMNGIFLVLMIVLFILNVVMHSLYVSRKIKKPLHRIAKGMKQVENGGKQIRLDFATEGEFTQIRDAFNLMIERVEAEEAEKRRTQEEKNRMVLELSHDLKTPIATIQSCVSALNEGIVAADELEKYYGIIGAKADKVNQMADDMFTMLKMENAAYVPDPVKMDICEFIRRQCAESYEDIENAGLELTVTLPDRAIGVYLDEKLMERVFGNLLGNAVKYNKSGKSVSVTLDEIEDAVEITVGDDGSIVDAEIRERLFEAFVKGDKARKSSGGTGLGLAIARTIVAKHGGRISYRREQSRNEFIIRLPKGQSPRSQ